MAVTRSWDEAIDTGKRSRGPVPLERRREFPLLLAASFVVLWGLALVYFAKTQEFRSVPARTAAGELLDLNANSSAERIAPFLVNFSDTDERLRAAHQVVDFVSRSGPLPNVGALARIRVTASPNPGNQQLVKAQGRALRTAPLLPVSKLKASFLVRTPSAYRKVYIGWCAVYFLSFWIIHVIWRAWRLRGDPAVLPALHLLTGIGLILAVSLRDPLRDTLEFKKFAWGSALGCTMLLLPLLRGFQTRNFSQWIYTPLFGSLFLFGLLLLVGSGPTGSDAKVNLGPFQPVELIKVLLVFFLAGYFARKWEWLRDLREQRFRFAKLPWLNLPRVEHVAPVVIGVAIALVFFFVLKDMGPALVVGLLFLSLFAVARSRIGLTLVGLTLLMGGVTLGYRLGEPHTVAQRVQMWLSPWDNEIRGGDQVAHSLWALSTGGAWGSGPGMGDPSLIPAGHTDLVLSSIGEEWGFIGILIIFLLFALLLQRAFRIARQASDDYSTFLAFGLGTLVACEMLLISGGVLDVIPLSGVVSPFLSSGNTAMLANFFIFAVLFGISHQRPDAPAPDGASFVQPMRVAAILFASLGLLLVARAAYFQVFADREFLIKDARVIEDDGIKRPQHNPRLTSLIRQIPRGDIFDRNGVLLATSNWDHLQQHRADLAKLGVSIDEACSRLESRHYPFGPILSQVLGDLRTGEKFHASNASLIEHDANTQLQGYGDLDELAPAIRYRHYPNDPRMRALLNRDRDVKTTLDVRLQQRLADLMDQQLEFTGAKGAAVVMDSASGDVLALASVPHPVASHAPTPDELLDRARYGEYPPGSTFKLVTAMAALRRDPESTKQTFACQRLPDGRAGVLIKGWNRPIRDDIKDHPHGRLDMLGAITQSCNAYFAQLGVSTVGTRALLETAGLLEIPTGDPGEFKRMLPFAAYGQGPVLTTPFKMARVVATIADGGAMPQGRWILGVGGSRQAAPRPVVPARSAEFLALSMRAVVKNGTGRTAMSGLNVPVAGKTGTAQVATGEPHSWFAGFAPYGQDSTRTISFAVVVEHGGYGARAAAPVARKIVEAARDLGLISRSAADLPKR